MDTLKQALLYAILIGVFWAVVVGIKRFSHVHVPAGYNDVSNLEEFAYFRVDRTVTLPQLHVDDPICYRIDSSEDHAVNFGWIAALPGDDLAVVHGAVMVNGTACARCGRMTLPDIASLRIPAHHVWVVTDQHIADSFAIGPIPEQAIQGRLASLP